jgi:uncharacterized protein
MRGIYTAHYLDCVSAGFSRRFDRGPLDTGKGFDLIVGTSTGAIVACALVSGIPLKDVVSLYRGNGKLIFRRRVPPGLSHDLPADLIRRPAALKRGNKALQTALTNSFGAETIGQVYKRRGIALAVTAVNLSNHRGWVFKTPHRVGKTNHRDDGYSLVDVCLASSAAPVYRSVAAINVPGGGGHTAFIDGGLWANNPILVGLIDALEVASSEQTIELYSLGTCPRPAGTPIGPKDVHRGLREWKFGAEAAAIAIDAQEFTFDHMAKLLAPHLKQPCKIVRFPREPVPAAMMQYLDLDDTRQEAGLALMELARTDADMTNSKCSHASDPEGVLLKDLFESMPEVEQEKGDLNV